MKQENEDLFQLSFRSFPQKFFYVLQIGFSHFSAFQSASTVTLSTFAIRMAVITFGSFTPLSILLISVLDIWTLRATSLWLRPSYSL